MVKLKMENKILVLGDGLLGRELVKQNQWDYVSRKKNKMDLFSLVSLIKENSHDVIVNCIANTDTYSKDKHSMVKVNYEFVVKLVEETNRLGKKLIQISTDYLYTHSEENVTEEGVPVHCNTWYGYTKLLADGYIESFSDNYLISRMGHKCKPFPHKDAWINQIGNFDYVQKQAKRLTKLIKNDITGIVNVGGKKTSMYDLAKQTKKDVNKDDCGFLVPKNVTMNLNKLNNILRKVNE